MDPSVATGVEDVQPPAASVVGREGQRERATLVAVLIVGKGQPDQPANVEKWPAPKPPPAQDPHQPPALEHEQPAVTPRGGRLYRLCGVRHQMAGGLGLRRNYQREQGGRDEAGPAS